MLPLLLGLLRRVLLQRRVEGSRGETEVGLVVLAAPFCACARHVRLRVPDVAQVHVGAAVGGTSVGVGIGVVLVQAHLGLGLRGLALAVAVCLRPRVPGRQPVCGWRHGRRGVRLVDRITIAMALACGAAARAVDGRGRHRAHDRLHLGRAGSDTADAEDSGDGLTDKVVVHIDTRLEGATLALALDLSETEAGGRGGTGRQ